MTSLTDWVAEQRLERAEAEHFVGHVPRGVPRGSNRRAGCLPARSVRAPPSSRRRAAVRGQALKGAVLELLDQEFVQPDLRGFRLAGSPSVAVAAGATCCLRARVDWRRLVCGGCGRRRGPLAPRRSRSCAHSPRDAWRCGVASADIAPGLPTPWGGAPSWPDGRKRSARGQPRGRWRKLPSGRLRVRSAARRRSAPAQPNGWLVVACRSFVARSSAIGGHLVLRVLGALLEQRSEEPRTRRRASWLSDFAAGCRRARAAISRISTDTLLFGRLMTIGPSELGRLDDFVVLRDLPPERRVERRVRRPSPARRCPSRPGSARP